MSLTNKYPNVLPYKIIQIEDKPRYYIEKNMFGKRDIEMIAKATYKDVNMSNSIGYGLVKKIIEKLCNQDDKAKMKEKVFEQRVIKRTKHISRRSMDKLIAFEELRDNGKRFHFYLTKRAYHSNCSNRDVERAIRNKSNSNDKTMAGIVYEINIADNKYDVCVYLPDYQGALITNLEYIELDTSFEPVEQLEATEFYLRGSKITKIDEWLDAYYKGGTGRQDEITFKFYAGENNKIIEEYSSSFMSSFGVPMEYELVDRQVEIENYDGSKEIQIVKDAVVKVKCNYKAFKRWYWEASRAYQNVVVIEPKIYNNMLIGSLTRRFQRRLEIYGVDITERLGL